MQLNYSSVNLGTNVIFEISSVTGFLNIIDIEEQVTCTRAAPAHKILAFPQKCQDHFQFCKRNARNFFPVQSERMGPDLVWAIAATACWSLQVQRLFFQGWRRQTQAPEDWRLLEYPLPMTPHLSVDRWSGEWLWSCIVSWNLGRGHTVVQLLFHFSWWIHLVKSYSSRGKASAFFYLWN